MPNDRGNVCRTNNICSSILYIKQLHLGWWLRLSYIDDHLHSFNDGVFVRPFSNTTTKNTCYCLVFSLMGCSVFSCIFFSVDGANSSLAMFVARVGSLTSSVLITSISLVSTTLSLSSIVTFKRQTRLRE